MKKRTPKQLLFTPNSRPYSRPRLTKTQLNRIQRAAKNLAKAIIRLALSIERAKRNAAKRPAPKYPSGCGGTCLYCRVSNRAAIKAQVAPVDLNPIA